MKRPFVIAAICLLLTGVVLVIGFRTAQEAGGGPAKTYCLVVENDTGALLMQLRRGMDACAERLGVKCTLAVRDTGTLEDQMRGLVRSGASGLLLLAALPDAGLGEMDVPVVLVGQAAPGYRCVTAAEPEVGVALFGADIVARLRQYPKETVLALDPYAMGYRALEAAVSGGPGVVVPLKPITSDTLYRQENAKLVFPLL